MKNLMKSVVGILLAVSAVHANAGLYTSSFGSLVPGYAQNDDNAYGPQTLGFTLNVFGTNYSSFYVSNNGLISFGSPVNAYSPTALNQETDGVIITPFWTDLDTRSSPDPASGVYLSQSANQTIVTWNDMGFYSGNYSGRVTFQAVLNSNGQVGFYYGNMSAGSDLHNAAAGFGDGLFTVNPGELSTASGSTTDVTRQLNQSQFLFSIANGVPILDPGTVPEPTTIAMLGLGLAALGVSRRKSSLRTTK